MVWSTSLQGHVWDVPKKVEELDILGEKIEQWLVGSIQVVSQFYKENGSPSSQGNKSKNVS